MSQPAPAPPASPVQVVQAPVPLQQPLSPPPPVPPPAPRMAANPPPPRNLGATPELFSGKTEDAENFWSTLENHFYLNAGLYADDDQKISTALTYFKVGTPAGQWAKDRQTAALNANPITFGTWVDFKDTFRMHFIPVEGALISSQIMHTMHMNSR